MKLSEAQIRQVIREELKVVLNENDENKPEQDLTAMDYVKSAGMGAGVTGAVVGAERLLWYIQTHPAITKPLIDLLKAMGHAVQE